MCETFTENLTTMLFDAADVQGGDAFSTNLCVKSVGSAQVSLSMTVIDLVDSETGCRVTRPQWEIPRVEPVSGN